MSSIYKRESGIWYYNGYGKRISLHTRSKREALKHKETYDQILASRKPQQLIVHNEVPRLFKTALDEYLRHKRQNYQPRTYQTDAQRLNWLLDYTGNISLQDMNLDVIEDYVEHCADVLGWKWSTVRISLNCWRAFLNYCIRKEYLNRTPFLHYRIKAPEPKIHYLSKEEVAQILDYHDPSRPWLHSLINLALATGFRRGELVTLRWENILPSVILVRGKTGQREFPATTRVKQILANMELESAWVFPSPLHSSQHLDADSATQGVKSAFRKLGFPEEYTLHTLRHTFASHLALSGTDIQRIKLLLGHKNISTTLQYAHLLPKDVEVKLPY